MSTMQATETLNEGLNREYDVVVPQAEITNRIQTHVSDLRKKIRMPGFRPGKVPESLIMKLHGKALRGQVLEETLTETTQNVLKEQGVRPAGQPAVDLTTFEEDSDLTYKIKVEVLPEFELPDLTSLSLERLVVPASDEQISEQLDQIAKSQRQFEAAEDGATANDGDTVVIDFLGKIDDEAFEGGSAEDFSLELGSGAFIPGFEDQLVGMKVGDKKDVEVTFPEDYQADNLAGKPAVFEVTIKELKIAKPVEIDDELAKAVGLDDLDTLKSTVKEQVERNHKAMARSKIKRALLDKLSAENQFEVPETMVDAEFNQIWSQLHPEDAAKSATDAGSETATDDDASAAEEAKPDPEIEKEREEYMAIARRRVRLGLLLSELGQKQQIEIRPDELNNAIMQEARRYPGQEKEVFEFFRSNEQALAQLRAPLYEEKVVDYILERAEIVDKEVTLKELEDALAEDDNLPEAI